MLTVIMTTYAPTEERAKYAGQAAESLYENLRVKDDRWYLQIADDGTPPDLFDAYYRPLSSRFTQVHRRGIGGSLNAALVTLQTRLWMYITDDWILTEPLDVEPAIALIEANLYDYVRLNPLHPNLCCEVKFNEQFGWWLHLYHEAGGFAFATRPFIAHRSLCDKIGPFKEKTDAYVTERDYSDRVQREPDVRLAALVDMHGPWKHIGEYEVGTIQP